MVPAPRSKILGFDSPIQFHPLTHRDREILLEMYRGFEPLGLDLGLPPRNEEGRESWVASALQLEINIGAFTPLGCLVGHSFIAMSSPWDAEMACFVEQGHRRRGIGTALVRAALRSAEQGGYQRVWAIIASENFPAVRLLKRCGFRFLQYALPAIEFEIELPRCGPDGTCRSDPR